MLRMTASYTHVTDEKEPSEYITSTWLPSALKGKESVKRLDSYALRRPMEIKANISNPEYDDRYSIKSVISCIIAGVQVISTTADFCIRMVDINSVHILDVIVMFTNWILFCQIILTLLAPMYYTKPL
ncbi:hypothetical protein CU097_010261 [Rhizopus azygosporus]|uniref:Uncharacterized protein n=1 Tax=Rhizopus azygosporus TaxID=86630 RepID=A0A367KGV2_RHIAZ|nr:hypothetical protein CU097_010261 [Rhizopus azygosporus]